MHMALAAGFRVHAVFFEVYPGMPLMTALMDEYERIFGIKILRVPHPMYFERARELTLMSPRQVRLCEQLNCWEKPGFEEVLHMYHPELDRMPAMLCIKACDSKNRFRTVWKTECFDVDHRRCYPLGWVSNTMIWDYIADHRIPMPDYYFTFGESLDVPRADMLAWLKNNHPNSYEHILRQEPLRPVEEARRKVGEQAASARRYQPARE